MQNHVNAPHYDNSLCVLQVRDKTTYQTLNHLLVEQIVTVSTDLNGSLVSAGLELKCVLLDVSNTHSHRNPTTFKAFYKPLENRASQTGGGVFLDLKGLEGQRIGTYLMFRVVQWLKQWPGSTMVNCIRVSAVDAKGENEYRRNRLYENLGFTFTYDEQGNGQSDSIPISELKLRCSWAKNIRVIPAADFLTQSLQQRANLTTELALIELWFKYSASEWNLLRDKPVKWGFKRLFSSTASTTPLGFDNAKQGVLSAQKIGTQIGTIGSLKTRIVTTRQSLVSLTETVAFRRQDKQRSTQEITYRNQHIFWHVTKRLLVKHSQSIFVVFLACLVFYRLTH